MKQWKVVSRCNCLLARQLTAINGPSLSLFSLKNCDFRRSLRPRMAEEILSAFCYSLLEPHWPLAFATLVLLLGSYLFAALFHSPFRPFLPIYLLLQSYS